MDWLVEFPGLGISVEVSRVAFTLFGFPIYWYGVIIGIGMALAVLFAFRQAKGFGVDVDRMIDIILIGFVCAIVGGRLYYVLFVDGHYRTFFELIDLRSGGIAIYGAIIGAFLGAWVGCRWRKVPLLPMFDLAAMGFLIGQGLGRWGNFFNQEAFGNNTTGIFGMISPATTAYLQQNAAWLTSHGEYVDPYMPVHPTFLYESVWCLAGFFLLWAYIKRRRFNGEIALFYVIWYGVGRFFIEGLRTDSLYILGIKVSQALALISALAAFAVWVVARRKTAGKPLVVPEIPPHTAIVKVPGADGVTAVTISWPADERAPDREQRMELAQKVLAAEKEKAKEEKEPQEKGEEDAEPKKAAKPAEKKAPKAKADEELKPAAKRAKKAETAEKEPAAPKKEKERNDGDAD